MNARLFLAIVVVCAATVLLAAPVEEVQLPVQKEELKGSAISEAIDAVEIAGGTYGVRVVGGKEIVAIAKQLGYDERSYYEVMRLSFGAVAGKPPLTDDNLVGVADFFGVFQHLEVLDLRGNDITARGLEAVPPLPLKVLRLAGPKITDDIAMVLGRFPLLTTLEFEGTAVTEKGVEAIKAVLPSCKINVEAKK